MVGISQRFKRYYVDRRKDRGRKRREDEAGKELGREGVFMEADPACGALPSL